MVFKVQLGDAAAAAAMLPALAGWIGGGALLEARVHGPPGTRLGE